MRFNQLYDADGGYRENPMENLPENGGVNPDGSAYDPSQENQPSTDFTGGPIDSATQNPAPSADPGPGPNSNPAPQGGPASPPIPPPPAMASSVPGVQGSEATGGVRGSFGQAGTAGFSKRFGMPAAWFRGGPTAGLAREAGNRGREVLGKDRAGTVSGSYGAETVGNVAGASTGEVGGGKNDEEFQRILRAVLQNKFGR